LSLKEHLHKEFNILKNSSVSGDEIKSGWGIEAEGGITAGEGIKAEGGIVAGRGITAGFCVSGYRGYSYCALILTCRMPTAEPTKTRWSDAMPASKRAARSRVCGEVMN
jgi:hypothetical protein